MKKLTAGLIAAMMFSLTAIPADAANTEQTAEAQAADCMIRAAEVETAEEGIQEGYLIVCGVALFWDGCMTGNTLQGVSYDPATSTLILNNYRGEITDGTGIMSALDNLRIELIGENVLYSNNSYDSCDGVFATGDLTIGGEGSLTIQLDEGDFGAGIWLYEHSNFTMESGELNIVTLKPLTQSFYGITKNSLCMGEESQGEFQFLGGTVNISAHAMPQYFTDTETGEVYFTNAVGIDSQHSDMMIKNTEINVELGGADSVQGVSTGVCVSWTGEIFESYGGALTIDNAVINVKSGKDYDYLTAIHFYEMNDLSDSLYYVGRRAANKKVSFEEAFTYSFGEVEEYWTDYEYVTISPTEIELIMAFDDVREGSDWYFPYVKYVFENQIMTGLNDIIFGANEKLARAQFAVILHRMNEKPEIAYADKFPDVKEGEWYTDAVLWANSIGVIRGYTNNGLFGTADHITREQMAVMMHRYAQCKGYDTSKTADFSRFEDASRVSGFAKEAMSWAVGTGIITGKDNNTKLDPQGNATRAECATIIQRFMQKYVSDNTTE